MNSTNLVEFSNIEAYKKWDEHYISNLNRLFGDQAANAKISFGKIFPNLLLIALMFNDENRTEKGCDREIVEFIKKVFLSYPAKATLQFLATRTLSYLNYKNVCIESPSLEIGVGNGITSNLIFENRKIDIGSSPLDELVSSARKISKVHGQIIKLDAQSIPLPDESTKTIIANNCIYHIPDELAALKEIYRVLLPGGKLYFDEVFDISGVSSIFKNLMEQFGASKLLSSYEGFRRGDYGNKKKLPYNDQISLLKILSDIGFSDINIRPYTSPKLMNLAYFFQDIDMVFGMRCFSRLSGYETELYANFINDTLIPLIEEDRELCCTSNNGIHYFVSAKK